MARTKNWWLKEDCRKCDMYSDCIFIETEKENPRGCSLFNHTIPEDKLITGLIKQEVYCGK